MTYNLFPAFLWWPHHASPTDVYDENRKRCSLPVLRNTSDWGLTVQWTMATNSCLIPKVALSQCSRLRIAVLQCTIAYTRVVSGFAFVEG